MNNTLDLKSALLGLALGIGATLLIGAAAPTSPTAPASPAGRYQLQTIGNHALMIDTTSGQAWETFLNTNSGNPGFDFYKAKTPAKAAK
jgi:hypothetical protein